LVCLYRSRVARALKAQKISKQEPAVVLLGCTPGQFKDYIQSKFLPGMTWENRGLWHVDHIRALSKFDLSTDEDRAEAFHYSNTQPLWAEDNFKKGNR
jgi:hypothetical protein